MGKYHDRINWKKELQLLPGYIIICAWVALTAAILFWIVCASLSSTKEILTGRVMDFSNGLKWDNYVTAWNTQNVSLYFFNSLVYAIVPCEILTGAGNAAVPSFVTFEAINCVTVKLPAGF